MTSEMKVMANSTTVFREEFDNWALLFNPEKGGAVRAEEKQNLLQRSFNFRVNPVGWCPDHSG
jgi:hypothetical protein